MSAPSQLLALADEAPPTATADEFARALAEEPILLRVFGTASTGRAPQKPTSESRA